MAGKASTAGAGRILERGRAVALARHYREVEGLSIREIADRLGRSPATVKAYVSDPTGEKARAVKARYVGVCRGCGAYTLPRNGKGDAYAYCKRCHPGAIARRWTSEEVLEAMWEWRRRYGRLPSSYDWSRTHAGAAAKRLNGSALIPFIHGPLGCAWSSVNRGAEDRRKRYGHSSLQHQQRGRRRRVTAAARTRGEHAVVITGSLAGTVGVSLVRA